MSLDLADHYVWDFWTVVEPESGLHHVFFLHAPRSLGDPDLRHRNARVGHATSIDLVSWTRLPDPLPNPFQGLDDLATWTGCVVRGADAWWLFTTGLSRTEEGRVQRIGSATSKDLVTWARTPLMLGADPARYQTTCADWPEEAWRDPWVVQSPDGRWHMYVTARAVGGAPGCGVVGHAISEDLWTWRVLEPLSRATGRFEWLEVISVVPVEGRWVLVFSCLSDQMPGTPDGGGGVWSVPVGEPGAPVDVGAAVRLTDERLYVGKVVHHAGAAHLLAFRNQDEAGDFVGGLIEPVPLTWRSDGRGLQIDGPFSPSAETFEPGVLPRP